MGRIRVLSDHVANKIAAGEVVERPASVVKELLENALDAAATRIRITVEGGGRKLIAVTDDGCGMGRDDALLAFERHATSKIRDLQDLDEIATLGFRGEALPAIASVARLTLETRIAEEAAGTRLEITGGKLTRVDDAGVPPGTSVRVEDLFFNVPARRKFLKAEATELAHIALVVTHYALAHPGKHFSLDTPSHRVLDAAPAGSHEERLYAIFGRETRDAMIQLAAERTLDRAGLPEPPPWRRSSTYAPPPPGRMRLYGFVSKPELQKLNRNSIYLFVNARVVRDRLLQHALSEAYRNLLPPAAFPVALLFLELPPSEVDANVHPAKTEVRFRQSAAVHDFVRDTARAALDAARPLPAFTRSISSHPTSFSQAAAFSPETASPSAFALQAALPPAYAEKLAFSGAIALDGNMAAAAIHLPEENLRLAAAPGPATAFGGPCAYEVTAEPASPGGLASLRPLGQLRDSFILAVNGEGLSIIDQHTAHERVLFERILRERESSDRAPLGQRLLLPIVIELTPSQWPVFALIAEELQRNGFEAEPFGARTIAVKTAPAGLRPADLERLLGELIEQLEREQQAENLATVRQRIAATVACHAAVKVNMPLEPAKLAWLLAELAQTESPMTCPHGRPVVLRYGIEEIQKAFKRTWGKF